LLAQKIFPSEMHADIPFGRKILCVNNALRIHRGDSFTLLTIVTHDTVSLDIYDIGYDLLFRGCILL